jgi:hypothetical protein
MKYNNTTLVKLEKLIEECGYVLRYERGNFSSGYCLLEQRKVMVLNKFLNTEGRINTLLELIPKLNLSEYLLTHESSKMLDFAIKQYVANEQEANITAEAEV